MGRCVTRLRSALRRTGCVRIGAIAVACGLVASCDKDSGPDDTGADVATAGPRLPPVRAAKAIRRKTRWLSRPTLARRR